MNQHYLHPPLHPRDGEVLRVMGIARISRETQDEKSLDDQAALLRQWVGEHYDGPVEWHNISGQGSGEVIQRQQVYDAENLVETRKYDLVILEDLGRHERRFQAVSFCELCEDTDTRLIAINDNLDTFNDWRQSALFTAFRHEQYNEDTSRRIKRSLRNRFENGGIIARPIYGYILENVESPREEHLHKDPAAEPIYDEWFRKLEDGATYSEIADWLNAKNIPVGRYCRSKKWKCVTVGQVTHNLILKGVRVRNRKMSKRINSSGKRVAVSAPPEMLQTRVCPHLAFIEAERYDRVLEMLQQRNAKYTRGRKQAFDSRKGVPRKRTIWPGQSMYCGVCGRVFHYGACGQIKHLICSGAIKYACWNGVSVDAALAADRICLSVWNEIQQLPEFEHQFVNDLRHLLEQRHASYDSDKQVLDQKMAKLERERERIMAAIRLSDNLECLVTEMKTINNEIKAVKLECSRLVASDRQAPSLPSMAEIRGKAAEIFRELPRNSSEFGRWMNRLIPRLEVVPYYPICGGKAVMRAEFSLNLPALLANPLDWEKAPLEVLHRPMTVDLFTPPQTIAYLDRVIGMAQDSTLRGQDIAEALGVTKTVVNRARQLAQSMKEKGLKDPYERLVSPIANNGKMRRHCHPRYCFDPMPGYEST